jgi:hypothetical protein
MNLRCTLKLPAPAGVGLVGGRNRRMIFSDSGTYDLVVPSILTTYRLVGTLGV